MRLIFACLTLTLILIAFAVGQSGEPGKNELTVWGGFSPDSNTFIPGFARVPDVRLGILGLRYSRRFNNGDFVNLKYTADVVPLQIINTPETATTRRTAFGFGFSPFGGQANFRPTKKVQPFVEIGGGFLYYDKKIPNDLANKFNFTANVGAGVEIRLENKRAVTIGYKYYHISNGKLADSNPGIDNNVFYVGYTFFSK